jgi:hypothetical protein
MGSAGSASALFITSKSWERPLEVIEGALEIGRQNVTALNPAVLRSKHFLEP